jgi:adenosine deaminase
MDHSRKYQDFLFCDLHNHLYGSLSAERLYEIGKKNPNPRWHLFLEPYEKAFGCKISPKSFFQDYNTVEKFSKLYYFNHRGPFSEFQAKFNLIIALVEFTKEEMRRVASRIVQDHASENVGFSEYRIMFAKDEPRDSFEARIQSVVEGILEGEANSKKAGYSIESTIAFSLHRSGLFREQYEWIKELMEKDNTVKAKLTGLDFCYVEEGYPPKDKKEFFQEILRDNLAESSTALAILYHVGESFQDKTPFSASRWVLESALYGVHRLGHCIALGISPLVFLHKRRSEISTEYRDQLQWELDHYDQICSFGEYYDREDLSKKWSKIGDAESIELEFGEEECKYLETFQNYCMSQIRKTKAVIESCPSSNFYIGGIQNDCDHPLPRFVKNKLKVTIASDDPGIFHTRMEEEYSKAMEMGVSEEDVVSILKESKWYRSEILSGRTPSRSIL